MMYSNIGLSFRWTLPLRKNPRGGTNFPDKLQTVQQAKVLNREFPFPVEARMMLLPLGGKIFPE